MVALCRYPTCSTHNYNKPGWCFHHPHSWFTVHTPFDFHRVIPLFIQSIDSQRAVELPINTRRARNFSVTQASECDVTCSIQPTSHAVICPDFMALQFDDSSLDKHVCIPLALLNTLAHACGDSIYPLCSLTFSAALDEV